jgi:dihydrodipicolinate synthase/N-acetylneuraminate lyase
MSYTPDELYGICGMMPAFSKTNAGDLTATETVDVDAIQKGLDRVIKDGVHMIATTGTFGQCWNLFPEEFQTLVRASIAAVNKRVPLMLGVTSANPREVVQRMKFVRDAGGEGVLLGVPYYYKLPIRDVISFYQEIGKLFPDLSIMIYHNPTNHRVHIPVAAFQELVKVPNIVAMKDSHRAVVEFQRLHDIIDGKISHFVNQSQLYPYYEMGAAGCWSHAIWSGPWPVLAVYDAVVDGDVNRAKRIIAEVSGGRAGRGEEGEGGRAGHERHEYAGYVAFGPPRPPFSFNMADTEEKARKGAAGWLELCEKYRPEVEARRAGSSVEKKAPKQRAAV